MGLRAVSRIRRTSCNRRANIRRSAPSITTSTSRRGEIAGVMAAWPARPLLFCRIGEGSTASVDAPLCEPAHLIRRRLLDPAFGNSRPKQNLESRYRFSYLSAPRTADNSLGHALRKVLVATLASLSDRESNCLESIDAGFGKLLAKTRYAKVRHRKRNS
jgi:hypothetical protein